MPYIIITRNSGMVVAPRPTRRAVATLDEAREATLDMLTEVADRMGAVAGDTLEDHLPAFADDARALTEAGGTVGPLPDGTVIEVESIPGYMVLWRIPVERRPHRTGHDQRSYLLAILDAFNAEG